MELWQERLTATANPRMNTYYEGRVEMMISSQRTVFSQLLLVSVCASLTTQASAADGIVARGAAARHGLHRAWVTQIQLDRSRSRLTNVTQHDATLFALTDTGLVHAIDAETGRTLWTAQFGDPLFPSFGPAVNDEKVAVVNGSQLFLMSRKTGRQLWRHEIGGAPAAGPELTDDRVYVPLVTGTIKSYLLDHHQRSPWIYFSDGRPLSRPLVTPDAICWTTDKGYLNIARKEKPTTRFRLRTDDAIVSRAAYRTPNYYCASLDGYVYAVDEESGELVWRFSAGAPVSQSPVVINDHVFVCPDHRGMVCLSTETGKQLWSAPTTARFVSASSERVYAVDPQDRLHILDQATGAQVGILSEAQLPFQLQNSQTDRIYFGTHTGLLQCLRETKLTEPVLHVERPQENEAEESTEDKNGVDDANPLAAEPDSRSLSPGPWAG